MPDAPWGPLRLAPIPVTRVWGGERLLQELHPDLDATPPIGETWEVSDVGDDPALHSRVSSGPRAGRTLRELIHEDRQALLGCAVEAANLPLLYKYIDARDALSVQVHPADELVAELGLPGYGKSEAWVIIDAAPGGEIIYGLEPGLTLHDYIERARAGRGVEGLRRTTVERGDIVHLPAGVLHAIGAGILLAEIQQSSDITYRLYDWERLGLDGKPRQLHLDEARRVVPPERLPPCPLLEPEVGSEPFRKRISGPPFSLAELRGEASEVALPHVTGERFAILSHLEGTATLSSDAGEESLGTGDVMFIPAACGPCCYTCDECSWTLWMQPGGS